MGSEETHPTASVHEEIPATSAEETAAAAEQPTTQTATEEELEIPQPEEPAIEIPEVVTQLTDTPLPKPKGPILTQAKVQG